MILFFASFRMIFNSVETFLKNSKASILIFLCKIENRGGFMNKEEPDQASLKVAIDRCSQEPIQFIGKIQDYGALIVLNESLRITHISENIQNIFNKEATDILSHHIEELIDYEILKKLLPKLHENAHVNHLRFNLYNIHKRNFCGVIHKYKNRIIIELEPLVETNNSLNSFDQTIETLNKFSDELVQYQEKEDLFKILAKWIQNIG